MCECWKDLRASLKFCHVRPSGTKAQATPSFLAVRIFLGSLSKKRISESEQPISVAMFRRCVVFSPGKSCTDSAITSSASPLLRLRHFRHSGVHLGVTVLDAYAIAGHRTPLSTPSSFCNRSHSKTRVASRKQLKRKYTYDERSERETSQRSLV